VQAIKLLEKNKIVILDVSVGLVDTPCSGRVTSGLKLLRLRHVSTLNFVFSLIVMKTVTTCQHQSAIISAVLQLVCSMFSVNSNGASK